MQKLMPLFDPLAKEEAAKGKKETTDKALGKKKWQFHLIVLDFIKNFKYIFWIIEFCDILISLEFDSKWVVVLLKLLNYMIPPHL